MVYKSEQTSPLNIVMGSRTFGKEGENGARVHNLADVGAILDVFQQHGHYEVDSARIYCSGTSEEYLGQLGWQERGIVMDTKLYPMGAITHSPEDLRKYLELSLKALRTECVDLWYLHGPDRKIDYAVTLKTVDELHREGKFKRLGISNYAAWEVAEMVMLCKANGWIQPTVYQGIYNVVHRAVEPELLPCLRKFGIAFYGFNPLAGGFFTGRYSSPDDEVEAGSRFDLVRGQGETYRKRYWNETYFKAVNEIKPMAEKHELTLSEIALRWMAHHSLLKREHGDAIIIGTSSAAHMEQNLATLEQGLLPEDVQKAVDEAWLTVKGVATKYFH